MAETATRASERSLFERFMARLEEWARGNEIDRLSAQELEHLAQDVGLAPHELARLAGEESDASRLLYARIESLGLTMEEIEARGVGDRRDMERTCGLCADRALCAHDLAERPESDAWRKVCPNSWTFDVMDRGKRTAA